MVLVDIDVDVPKRRIIDLANQRVDPLLNWNALSIPRCIEMYHRVWPRTQKMIELCGVYVLVFHCHGSGNDSGNGAAAKNYDFKTRVIGGSRSPHGYAIHAVNPLNVSGHPRQRYERPPRGVERKKEPLHPFSSP